MKTKWQTLTWPQRVLLLLQVFLVVLFLILYATLGQQKVTWYNGTVLRYRLEGETAVCSGKVDGQKVVFTVSPGPVVEYRLGDTLYGAYTITEDPTAVPSENEWSIPSEVFTGVEIRKDGQIWFRGGYDSDSNFFLLVAEDGTDKTVTIMYGKPDPEPSVRAILSFALNPQVVQRGSWANFWLGVLCCAFCTALILFADKLFRWNLRFIIRNPEDTEPSDWELFSRWVGWIALTIVALVCFITGLNGHL